MRRFVLSCLVGLVVAASCTELPEIEPDLCGNGVVEAGEDCDSFDQGPHVCRTAGDGACRFECAKDVGPPCPPGWGCGEDGICRKASGSYELWGEPLEWPTRQIFVADFDGDTRDDVLTVADDVLVASYLDESGAIESESVLFIDRALPAVGDLTGDALADLVVARPEGIGVYRGQSDRTFASTAYSSQVLPVLDAVAAGVEVLPQRAGVEPLSLVDFFGAIELLFVDLGPQSGLAPPILANFGMSSGPFPESLPAGSVIEDFVTSPCDEVIVAFDGASSVFMVTPCRLKGGEIVLNETGPGHVAPVPIALALGAKVAGGAHLFDLNMDGHLDLMIGARAPDMTDQVHAAMGLGDGTFHSDADALPPSQGDNTTSLSNLERFPLALGHLNDDPFVDYVLGDAVYVSHVVLEPTGVGGGGPSLGVDWAPATSKTPGRWTHAIVADFNANGIPDVVATNAKSDGVDFFNGAGGGLLNEVTIPTEGAVTRAAAGDFDGDTVVDLALAESPGAGDAGEDFVSVLFGRHAGAPEAPVRVGRLGKVTQLLGAAIANDACYADGIAELAVLSQVQDDLSLAVLRGTPDRQLQAPFELLRTIGDVMEPGSQEIPSRPLNVFLGELAPGNGEDAHLDIGALGREGTSFLGGRTSKCGAMEEPASRSTTAFRLWLAESTGEAELTPGTTNTGDELPFNPFLEQAILLPVDLDRDGVDELVTFVFSDPDSGASGLGNVVVARSEERAADDPEAPKVSVFASDDPEVATEGFFRDLKNFLQDLKQLTEDVRKVPDVPPGLTGLARAVAVDLDGDEYLDVIVQGISGDQDQLRSELIVFWNAGGKLDVAGRTLLPPLPDAMAAAFAVADVDGDTKPDVIVVHQLGAHVVKLDGRTPSDPVPLPGVAGGHAVFAADLTRDGLPDLVVGSETNARIFRARPILE